MYSHSVSQSVSQSASQSQSYFETDSQSVSLAILTLSPSGTHDQILIVVKTIAFLFAVGHSPC